MEEVAAKSPEPQAVEDTRRPGVRAQPESAVPELPEIPERRGYRLKNRLLGPPLVTEQLATERLGKPTALAVLSSDCISSSAYATEEILTVLVPVVGVAAFSLVIPVTLAVIVVLFFVTLSYREVVTVYTKAGGSYVVARENFGPKFAQVAAVSLLIDYTLTVAVSVAAGVAALTSAFSILTPYAVWISIGFVLIIAYGNLRGIREAGRLFAVPTYLFITSIGVVILVGSVRKVLGKLPVHSIYIHGAFTPGHPGSGLLLGASLFIVLRAFASGGSALTGVEAISNGVSIFRPPEARNARRTLVVMSLILGSLVLGLSVMSSFTHATPFISGSPTVISQIARDVLGSGWLGDTVYFVVQMSTMLVLVLAANTSFTGFPLLASFAAADSYLPRQLMRRGHRLVFSTTIWILTAVAIVLLVATRAEVSSLIPLYAIGVFTGFTIAGAGMAKYHHTHREPQWRRRLVINSSAAVLAFVVDVIFAVTKFSQGAWVVLLVGPLGVILLLRFHRQYAEEEEELAQGALRASEAPILRRHISLILVDRLDLATARTIQYARSMAPDEIRAVHFLLDSRVARELEDDWGRLGLSGLPLDIVECPDRRLARAALELAAQAASDGETEVNVLLPRRIYSSALRRLLHDRTADRIAEALGEVEHVSATIVPYRVGRRSASRRRQVSQQQARTERAAAQERDERASQLRSLTEVVSPLTEGTVPISTIQWRKRARVAGRVTSVRVQPRAGVPSLECTLADDTGQLLLVFPGRRRVPGIEPGSRLVAEGMVGGRGRQFAMLNPFYELVSAAEPQQG